MLILLCRQDFIDWFVETQLQDYRASFPENSEVSRLDHVERRYAWLMRELRYLDEVYQKKKEKRKGEKPRKD